MASIHRLNILAFDQNYVLQMNFSTEMSTVYMGKKKKIQIHIYMTGTWTENYIHKTELQNSAVFHEQVGSLH